MPSKLLIRCTKEEYQQACREFGELLQNYSKDAPSTGSSASPPLATIIHGFLPAVGDWFLEILHPEVNKGNGLKRMCQALDIPIDQTVAMGDGTNDVEFLTLAGLGVAMKNAHESLQDAADYTMEWTNDEHGVIKTMEQLTSQGRIASCNTNMA